MGFNEETDDEDENENENETKDAMRMRMRTATRCFYSEISKLLLPLITVKRPSF